MGGNPEPEKDIRINGSDIENHPSFNDGNCNIDTIENGIKITPLGNDNLSPVIIPELVEENPNTPECMINADPCTTRYSEPEEPCGICIVEPALPPEEKKE